MTDLLVIGYGNDLRSDDGAGRQVAQAIEDKALAGVTVRSFAQLTPELALDVVRHRQVVFVDANVDATEVTVEPVAAGSGGGGVMTHHGSPSQLLALAGGVGEVPEDAVVISIPAQNLELGFTLSGATAAGVAAAVEIIAAMVTGDQKSQPAE